MKTEVMKKILYIEDEEGLAYLLTRRLNRHGYAVDTAINSTLGFEMLEAHEYDLVLVDYKLPLQSGLDVIGQLSQRIDAPPTIMVTGAGNERIAVEAIKHGASDYIVKDSGRIYLEVLPSKIDKAVEQHLLKLEAKRAQEALRESEERLRSTVESLDDIVLLINPEHEFIDYYRPKGNIVNKIPIETFVGKQVSEVLPENITKMFHNAIQRVSESGDVQDFDYQLQISGSIYWFSVKISQRNDVHGQYNGVTVVVRDITNRKNTEQTLRQSEERFKLLFEFAPSGMLILSPDGYIRHVNQAFRQMLDFDADQLLDMPLHSLVHPNEKDNLRFDEQETRSSIISTEIRFLRSNRQIVHTTVQATRLNFESSLNDYLLMQISDVSDRKAAEARLFNYINLIEIVQQIDDEMHQTLRVDDVLDIAINTLHTIGSPECTVIALSNPENQSLIISKVKNASDALLNQPLPISNIGRQVEQTLLPEWVDDISQSQYEPILPTSKIVVAIPMTTYNRLLGVVILESSSLAQLNIDVYDQLKIIVSRIAIALNSALLFTDSPILPEISENTK